MADPYGKSSHTVVRWRKTVAFLEPVESAVQGLDLGERTALTSMLESFFGCPFTITDLDLDTGILDGQYDIVTCFEVIEHLFNPLHCLFQIKKVLAPDGRLYLSTPRYKPHIIWDAFHFHEMTFRSIAALIDRAGFTIIRKQIITTYPWWFYFTGVRPLLRSIFDRNWLFELAVRS